MKVKEVESIPDLKIIEPTVFQDERGYFYESYNKNRYEEAGIKSSFVQDNESYSQKGVLRGLHYQKGEFAQAKLVRVIQGKVWDVAVDIRSNSTTYLEHFGIELSAENKKQFYIPRGFAHGFLVLSKYALFSYKCDNYYHKDSEGGIYYSCPTLDIKWPTLDTDYIISEKDQQFQTL